MRHSDWSYIHTDIIIIQYSLLLPGIESDWSYWIILSLLVRPYLCSQFTGQKRDKCSHLVFLLVMASGAPQTALGPRSWRESMEPRPATGGRAAQGIRSTSDFGLVNPLDSALGKTAQSGGHHTSMSTSSQARERRVALARVAGAGPGAGGYHLRLPRTLPTVLDRCLRGRAPVRPPRDRPTGLPPREGLEIASVVLQLRLRAADSRRDPTELPYQRLVIAPCLAAGLQVRSFYGATDLNSRRTIFVQVWASNERLLEEAERTKMALLLDPHELAAADARVNRALANNAPGENGRPLGSNGGANDGSDDAALDDEFLIPALPTYLCSCSAVYGSALDPYVRIYAPFVSTADRRLYARNGGTNFILSDAQALRALLSIMEASIDVDGGAGLDLDLLVDRGVLTRWSCAHAEAGRARLARAWASTQPWMRPWRPPLEALRDYLGEKVAMHFAFIAHLVKWLAAPALFGLPVFIYLVSTSDDTSVMPIYAMLVSVWATVFMEFWKREQSRLAQRWGMTDFKRDEPLRPEFVKVAARTRSVVHGRPSVAADPTAALARWTVSVAVTAVVLTAVAFVVVSILFFGSQLENSPSDGVQATASYIASGVNAVQVALSNVLYGFLATFLAWWENAATPTEHENSLIYKNSLFQLLNTFLSLFYIAFVKASVSIDGQTQNCTDGNCLVELQQQLAIFIVLNLGVEAVNALVVPAAWRFGLAAWRRLQHTGSSELRAAYAEWRAAVNHSPVERIADALPYSTFRSYITLMLLFGLATLFIVAFSLAPTLVYVALVFSLALDRNLVLNLTARRRPDGAADIGAWQAVFELLCYACTVTNLAVTAFASTGHAGPQPIFSHDFSILGRLIFFILAENAIIIVKVSLRSYIDDATSHTKLQLQRQEYLVQKHILGVAQARPTCPRLTALMRAAAADAATAEQVAPAGAVRPAHSYATMIAHQLEGGNEQVDL